MAMATGWAEEGAVQDQIDATVKDAIKRAKSQLPAGPALDLRGVRREDSRGAPRGDPGRAPVPGVPGSEGSRSGAQRRYNRRGSKDSQLRDS